MSNNICTLESKESNCIPKKNLQIISEVINEDEHDISDTPNIIIKKLSNKLECNNINNIQNTELCILKKIEKNTNNKELKQAVGKQLLAYFKPIAKRLDGNYWLNNSEIDMIQYQFQNLFEGYYYSFIHMIDFNMYPPQVIDYIKDSDKIKPIHAINFIDELQKNKNRIFNFNGDLKYFASVFNTDVSTGTGIHWISFFIDFTAHPITIEYFNSSGYPLTNGEHPHYRKKCYEFYINLADDLTRAGYDAKFIQVTNIEHQRSNTANCGSYSLYYIWKRLNGIPYSYFSDNKILDEDMENFRSFLWRTKSI